jgi:DNA-directed RNA polymerase subunit RPC12/RpoP
MPGSDDASRFYPLMQAAHCLRCGEHFEVGTMVCPTCGSKACVPVTPVLTRARRRSPSVYVEDPVRLAA